MKMHLLVILIFFICFSQIIYCQEDDGVVSLVIPNRNSLTFNRYTINPAFSFVREQNKYISFTNKREWVQFEDAPLTYLASYSGRFAENIGAGLGFFQQNYGVLTTFGGILNFAYNARLARESNLTFGLNVGAYRSGVNTSNVVTNFDDPALQNVPENFLLTVNPGINLGLAFFDFGLSVNNLVVYNFQTSNLIKDIPERGIQAHIMYTGYMQNGGFFNESKFSGLLRTEVRKDETITSALLMLTVPRGIWAQAGYNTRFGISAGLGINITPQFALEYNFERTVGDLSVFGPSHDITLAYRFKSREQYDYSSGDEVSGLFSDIKLRKKRPNKMNVSNGREAELRARAEERKARIQAERLQQTNDEAEQENARIEAERQAQQEAQERARLLAEKKAREEAVAKKEAEEQAKHLAEQKAKADAERRARLEAEQKAREEAQAQAKALAQQKAKEQAERRAQELAEQKAQEEAEEKARLLAEQKAREEAEAQAKLLAEQQAEEEANKLQALEERLKNPEDDTERTMLELTRESTDLKQAQNRLLDQFNEMVNIKDEDLKYLKEENDLSEQGISVEPRPFKSVVDENRKLQAIKAELDSIIEARNKKIKELRTLQEENYEVGTIVLDEVLIHYRNTLKRLESEQMVDMQTLANLELRLKEINRATEYEKRRRIKRAAYDNEEERYENDRAALKHIKLNTAVSKQPLSPEDFDFGDERSSNIQILKNIKNVEKGYYLILAIHNDAEKRNDFVTKVVASGGKDVDFFYDVNTSKYYIYIDKFDSIEAAANEGLKSKGTEPYNINTSIVKIEN